MDIQIAVQHSLVQSQVASIETSYVWYLMKQRKLLNIKVLKSVGQVDSQWKAPLEISFSNVFLGLLYLCLIFDKTKKTIEY